MKEEDLHDLADAKIELGTKCLRKGCGKEFKGDESRTEECQFHSGSAVFHEGSKVSVADFYAVSSAFVRFADEAII